jgi:hypothetical protein
MTEMKYTTPITIAFLCLIAFSCNNSAATKAGDATQAADPSAPVAASVDASVSFTLNGVALSGKGVDEMQFRNTAFLYPDEGKGEQVLMFLYNTKDGADTKPDYYFRLRVPSKPGTYTVTAKDEFDPKTMPSVTFDLMKGDLSRYWVGHMSDQGDVATVTITSNDGKRVTGTFSGTLSLSNDTPRGTIKKMVVTDGKFDVPFSTSKLRPE